MDAEKPKKNSGNSSTPPSKESIKGEVIRMTKKLHKPNSKEPYVQDFHKGHSLSYHSMTYVIVDDTPRMSM